MEITLTPVFSDDPIISASAFGDVLTIGDQSFDFGPLQDGAHLPAGAIDSPHFIGPVERIDGELHLTLRFPHGWDASERLRFPEPIHMTGDGPVPLPVDPVPEPLQPPTLEPAE